MKQLQTKSIEIGPSLKKYVVKHSIFDVKRRFYHFEYNKIKNLKLMFDFPTRPERSYLLIKQLDIDP